MPIDPQSRVFNLIHAVERAAQTLNNAKAKRTPDDAVVSAVVRLLEIKADLSHEARNRSIAPGPLLAWIEALSMTLENGIVDMSRWPDARAVLIEMSDAVGSEGDGAEAATTGGESAKRALTETELKVLRRLAESPMLLKGPDAYTDVAERAGKEALASLETMAMIHRPAGPKSGWGATDAGKQAASQMRTIRAPSAHDPA